MGLFFSFKDEEEIKLDDNKRCNTCGKKIKKGDKAYYIDGKYYCVKYGAWEVDNNLADEDDLFGD